MMEGGPMSGGLKALIAAAVMVAAISPSRSAANSPTLPLIAFSGPMVGQSSAGQRDARSVGTIPVDGQDAAAQWKRLDDAEAGYTLYYPSDWLVEGQVVASEFASGAHCRSVRIVDFAPPPDSGAAAPIQHSFVQVCARPASSLGSLEAFMNLTYGDRLDVLFEKTQVNRLVVYDTGQRQGMRMLFAELAGHVVQIIASVETEPARRPERRAQVEKILASFSAI